MRYDISSRSQRSDKTTLPIQAHILGTLTTGDVIRNATSSNLQDSTATGRPDPESPPKWLVVYLELHAPTEENLLLSKTEFKSDLGKYFSSLGLQIALTDPWRQLLSERVDMEWPLKLGTLEFDAHMLEIRWDLEGPFQEFGSRLEYMDRLRVIEYMLAS